MPSNVLCWDWGRTCQAWSGLVKMKLELGHSLTLRPCSSFWNEFSFPGNKVETHPIFSSHAISPNHNIPHSHFMSPIHHNKVRFDQCQQIAAIAVASTVDRAAYTAASLYHSTSMHQPYHMSVLSEPAWVCELLVTVLERKSGLHVS